VELGAPSRLELGASGRLEFVGACKLGFLGAGRLGSKEANMLGSEAVGTWVFNEGGKGAAIILQVQLLLCFVRIEDLHQHYFGMDF
jgi:hypothetical protein